MSYTTPKYALTAPDNETELRKLGTETKAMVQRIEAVLEAFDYDGADPSLVLARVAALEASHAEMQRGIATLPAGSTYQNPTGVHWSPEISVTFPRPYPAGVTPVVTLTTRGNGMQSPHLTTVTPTGFTYRVARFGAAIDGGTLHWEAGPAQ